MPGIKDYFSLVKIQHTLFALPFAMIGLFLAFRETGEPPRLRILLLVVLCVLLARNAAMAFNRYIDREFDIKNPRTALREIPANLISPRSALLFVLLNCVLFIVATAFLNPLCLFLSPVALVVLLGYSFTKRFTSLAHLFLGMGLALAPIGAYLAVTARFDWLPLLYSFAVLFWVAGFDIIYALQDYEFDVRNKLKSIPVLSGKRNALRLSAGFHVIALGLICTAGFAGDFSWIYWTGATVFGGLVVYQHLIVKPDDLSRVNLAFFTLNGIASLIFAGFVIADIIL